MRPIRMAICRRQLIATLRPSSWTRETRFCCPIVLQTFTLGSAAYTGLEEYEKAIEDGKAAVAKNPGYPKGYVRQAAAMREIDQVEDALALLDKAPAKLREDPAVVALVAGLQHDYAEDNVLGKGITAT